MKEVAASITPGKMVGLATGSVFIAICGLSSVTQAMPTGWESGGEHSAIDMQHDMGSGTDIIRLVGTRDHDEDPIPDGSTQQMNNPKKKTDQSMKPGAGSSKNRAGQGPDGQAKAKTKQSPKGDQQEQGGDRPDDRRQGKNIDPTP